jgi:hypothetical protein
MFFRYLLATLAVVLWASAADAHRPGESYVYLDVSESEVTGKLHIRLSDLTKAIPLDQNDDGLIEEGEFEAKVEEVKDYLTGRLTFHDADRVHGVRLSGHRFFGPEDARQVEIDFEIPTLGPPPDNIDVEYRFLYDGIEPAHRPMVLQSSNTRMGLVENEAVASAVFGVGSERQPVSLVPPPPGQIFQDFVFHGIFQALSAPLGVLLLAALFLPSVMRRVGGRWAPLDRAPQALAAAGGVAAAFVAGYMAALVPITQGWTAPLAVSPSVVLALSALVIAADNFRPFAYLRRWHLALALGLAQGALGNGFMHLLGLNQGFAEIALAGFAVGLGLAVTLVAAAVVPLPIVLRSLPVYRRVAHDYASLALVVLGAAALLTSTAFS